MFILQQAKLSIITIIFQNLSSVRYCCINCTSFNNLLDFDFNFLSVDEFRIACTYIGTFMPNAATKSVYLLYND